MTPLFSTAEGNLRLHDPVQDAKFSLEAGVIVRSQVPIFTHWKEYKAETEHFDVFVGRLSGRLEIDRRHKPTTDACVNVFKSGIP
ncbi:hypothetical protein PAHAL_5G366400 [Panicum hallii]|uniref:Uncharacterized protein n=1 Tax=Panicum hallii TaxID=206008 RepID=A0A2T8IMI6_9POAL|nr:hypothetical protein PAHAL_5G366400 [Panicum hallii]